MSKFNLLAYILPPEDKVFYQLFAKSAQFCIDSAILYNDIIQHGLSEESFEKAKKFKKQASKNLKLTLKHLNRSFITPLEREDIQDISVLLYKITKKITKTCRNFRVYNVYKATEEMKEQAETLRKSTQELEFIIKHLKKISDVSQITKSNIKMKELESSGDEIMHRAIGDLFSGKYEAIDVIKYRDIYKEIENALDACFSVADVVLNIVLKQS